MFNNFFKLAIRNIVRHKGFSFINIAGLTLGCTAFILICLFVWDEYTYDRNIPGKESIYRLYVNRTTEENNENVAMVPPAFATALKQQFPDVENVTRVFRLYDKQLLEYKGKQLYQEKAVVCDSSFFNVFPANFVYGSPSGALSEPTSILISEELSLKIYGNSNPVGQTLTVNKQDYQVKGVYRNDPKFHLQMAYMLPLPVLLKQIPEERMKSWGWMQWFTYCKVKKGTDIASLERKFQQLAKKEGAAFSVGEKYNIVPHFQSLEDVHLKSSDFKHDMAVRGNGDYVKALTIIAFFILLIACFNFINLATAKSVQRAKEVGVRKVIGASRTELVVQFIGEAIFLAFISIIISVALSFLILPSVNQFTEKNISFPLFSNPILMVVLLLFSLLIGILSGFYPAIVLSDFRPVQVLKSSILTPVSTGLAPFLRQGLVIVQFTISVTLIISAIIVYRQVNYLHNKDLGFQKEEIMFFQMRGDKMYQDQALFKNELMKQPGVSSVSIGYGFPGDATAGDQIIVPMNGEEKKMPAAQLLVDYDYIKTLKLQIIAGRDFSRDKSMDSTSAFIINETAVRQMGFGTPEKAIGKTLLWPVWESQQPDSLKRGQIIGVVKDFHFKSLYDKLETTVLQIYPQANWKVAVKINSRDAAQTIAKVTETWNKFSPDQPLEYRFLDDSFELMYKPEDKLRSLLLIFTCIAIFVGCLGLFGLSAYAAERRKKEIGIRKVLGASVEGIVMLLSKDFVKLVLISLVIATPIAWWSMYNWLLDFPYRMDISWWIFAISGAVAIVIALLTVFFQSVKAALVNPVRNLRAE